MIPMEQMLWLDPGPRAPRSLKNRGAVRLWKERFGILTHSMGRSGDAYGPKWLAVLPGCKGPDGRSTKGKDIGTLMAEYCAWYDETGRTGYGATELQAIEELAERRKLRLP